MKLTIYIIFYWNETQYNINVVHQCNSKCSVKMHLHCKIHPPHPPGKAVDDETLATFCCISSFFWLDYWLW